MESSMSWQTILEKVGKVKRVCPILRKGTVPVKLMIMVSSCILQRITKIWRALNIRCSYGIYLTCYSRVHDFERFSNLFEVYGVVREIVFWEYFLNHV